MKDQLLLIIPGTLLAIMFAFWSGLMIQAWPGHSSVPKSPPAVQEPQAAQTEKFDWLDTLDKWSSIVGAVVGAGAFWFTYSEVRRIRREVSRRPVLSMRFADVRTKRLRYFKDMRPQGSFFETPLGADIEVFNAGQRTARNAVLTVRLPPEIYFVTDEGRDRYQTDLRTFPVAPLHPCSATRIPMVFWCTSLAVNRDCEIGVQVMFEDYAPVSDVLIFGFTFDETDMGRDDDWPRNALQT